MEDWEFWKKKEWLVAHEVALLVIGIDPRARFDEEPIGWRPIYDTLILALNRYRFVKAEFMGFDGEGPFEGIFRPGNIKGDAGGLNNTSTFGIRQTAIFNWLCCYNIKSTYFTAARQTAIPEWLYPNGIESDYFSSLDNPVKTEVITRPEYQTELMVIMYATIKRYYGENYDPNDSDTAPKQNDVIGWIRNTYSISEAKAKAVEKMTRPD
jgi:hypothetical protein